MGSFDRSQINNLESLVVAITTERNRKGADPKTIGKLLEEFRAITGFSQEELCAELGFSKNSYSKWKGSELIAKHRIKDLRAFVVKLKDSKVLKDSIKLPSDSRLTLRPLEQILDRQARCKRVFSIKHMHPIRAGVTGDIQNQMIELLTDVEIHCIFWAPKNFNPSTENQSPNLHSEYPALDSYASLKKALIKENPSCANLFGWGISDYQTAFNIGLSEAAIGMNILEYDEKKTMGHPWRIRGVDIFFEISHSVYGYELHSLKTTTETRWSELSPSRAKWHWKKIKPLLQKIADGKLGTEVCQPILMTKEDIEIYEPKEFQ